MGGLGSPKDGLTSAVSRWGDAEVPQGLVSSGWGLLFSSPLGLETPA